MLRQNKELGAKISRKYSLVLVCTQTLKQVPPQLRREYNIKIRVMDGVEKQNGIGKKI